MTKDLRPAGTYVAAVGGNLQFSVTGYMDNNKFVPTSVKVEKFKGVSKFNRKVLLFDEVPLKDLTDDQLSTVKKGLKDKMPKNDGNALTKQEATKSFEFLVARVEKAREEQKGGKVKLK